MPILIAPQKVDLTIIKVLVDEKTKKTSYDIDE